MDFNSILEKTLEHEGFYANVKGDRGGETYRGVARNIFPNWEGWVIVDSFKKENGGSLSWNQKIYDSRLDTLVDQFYYNQFWVKSCLDEINNKQIAVLIFDFHVNAGANAIKEVQRVLNYEFDKSLIVDGVSGKLTIGAINSVDAKDLFNMLNEYRVNYYKRVSKYGQNYKFLNGWLKRASSFVWVD